MRSFTIIFAVALLQVIGSEAGCPSVATCPADDQFVEAECVEAIAPIVIDSEDGDVVFVGDWKVGTLANTGFLGANYRHDGNSADLRLATYEFSVPSPGMYNISTSYSATTSRATDVPYTIADDSGSTVVTVDQTCDGCRDADGFAFLGTFAYINSADGSLQIQGKGTSDVRDFVIADAIRIQSANPAAVAGQEQVCGNCTVCAGAPIEFESVPCTVSSDRECTSCTSAACPSEEYESLPCTDFTDRVCDACNPACRDGEFESVPCTPTSNRECTQCSAECAPGSFLTANCTATDDITCQQCQTCARDQYVETQCSATVATVCANCTECGSDQYEEAPCDDDSDAICKDCVPCDFNFQFEVSPCNATHNAVCQGFTVCTGDQYEEEPLTQSSDRVCKDITECLAGSRIRFPATATSDNDCEACGIGFFQDENGQTTCDQVSTCQPGQFVVATFTQTSDRSCGDCTSGVNYSDEFNTGSCTPLTTCTPGQEESGTPAADQDRVCTACGAGFFQDEANQASCKPETNCGIGEEPVTAPTVSSDRVCADCSSGFFQASVTPNQACQAHTQCANGVSFESAAPTSTSDRECSNLTECSSSQYEMVTSTSVSDRVCDNCTVCRQNSEITPCNATADAVCSGCDTCEADEYISADCTDTEQTVCAQCDVCNTGFYERTACGGHLNTDCVECTVCGDDQFETQTCTASTNRMCADHKDCASTEFETGAPTSSTDRDCTACRTTDCTSGFYKSADCSEFEDVVCSPCDSCDAGFEEISPCTATSNTQCQRSCDNNQYSAVPPVVIDAESHSTVGNAGFKIGSAVGQGFFMGSNYFFYDDLTPRAEELSLQIGFMVPVTTTYEVELSYSPGANRDAAVPVIITHADGRTTVTVDQTVERSFVSLGTFKFESNAVSVVKVHTAGTTGIVTVDGLRLTVADANDAASVDTSVFECTNCTICDAELYATQDCDAFTDTVCGPCDTCASHEYASKLCLPDQNRECANITSCVDGEYEEAAPTATSDRVCTPISECTANQFEQAAPTETSDRMCVDIRDCAATQFETAAPTNFTDRVCQDATECTGELYEISPLTLTMDRSCSPCTQCTGDEYETTPCSPTSNRVCAACSVGCSGPDEYISSLCSATSDRLCSTCSDCDPNTEYTSTPCGTLQDRECTTITESYEYGEWSGWSASCSLQLRSRVESCPAPACLESSSQHSVENRDINGGCEFNCTEVSFFLFTRIDCSCPDKFTLASDLVSCIPPSCGMPVSSENASPVTGDVASLNDQVAYVCNSGFTLTGMLGGPVDQNVSCSESVSGAEFDSVIECLDVDECAAGVDECNTTCHNLEGSFCCQQDAPYEYSEWSAWSTTCGNGTRTRVETCPATCNGICTGQEPTMENRDTCCPVDQPFTYGPYPQWAQKCSNQTRDREETCTATCGGICHTQLPSTEHLTNGGCQHTCVEDLESFWNTIHCECDGGFMLAHDGRSCMAVNASYHGAYYQNERYHAVVALTVHIESNDLAVSLTIVDKMQGGSAMVEKAWLNSTMFSRSIMPGQAMMTDVPLVILEAISADGVMFHFTINGTTHQAPLMHNIGVAALSWENSIPTVSATATGTGVFWYRSEMMDPNGQTTLMYSVVATDVNTITAAHFHGPARQNETAGVVEAISLEAYGGTAMGANFASVSATHQEFFADDIVYVNVHTSTNPSGELRGQVLGLEVPTVIDCATAHRCTQDCNTVEGGYECSCRSGFILNDNDVSCDDINECNQPHNCTQQCVNTLGSFSCECNVGFSSSDGGLTCDVVECGFPPFTILDVNGSVNSKLTSAFQTASFGDVADYECIAGLTFDMGTDFTLTCTSTGDFSTAPTCVDIDECADNNGGCDQICVNEFAGFSCECSDGYELVGGTCVIIDQCMDGNNGGCEQVCSYSTGSIVCSCNSGFALASSTACVAVQYNLLDGAAQDIAVANNQLFVNGGDGQESSILEFGSDFTVHLDFKQLTSGYLFTLKSSDTIVFSLWSSAETNSVTVGYVDASMMAQAVTMDSSVFLHDSNFHTLQIAVKSNGTFTTIIDGDTMSPIQLAVQGCVSDCSAVVGGSGLVALFKSATFLSDRAETIPLDPSQISMLEGDEPMDLLDTSVATVTATVSTNADGSFFDGSQEYQHSVSASNDFSVSLAVRTTDDSGELYASYDAFGSDFFSVKFSATQIMVEFGSTTEVLSWNVAIADDVYHRVLVTFEQTSFSVGLHVDYVPYMTMTAQTADICATDCKIRIGAGFIGVMSQAKQYNAVALFDPSDLPPVTTYAVDEQGHKYFDPMDRRKVSEENIQAVSDTVFSFARTSHLRVTYEDQVTLSSGFSIAAYVNINNRASGFIVAKSSFDGNPRYWTVYYDRGCSCIRFEYTGPSSGGLVELGSNLNLDGAGWKLVLVTVSTSGDVTLSIDGIVEDSGQSIGATGVLDCGAQSSDCVLMVGARSKKSSPFSTQGFSGKIAMVRVYPNTVLTSIDPMIQATKKISGYPNYKLFENSADPGNNNIASFLAGVDINQCAALCLSEATCTSFESGKDTSLGACFASNGAVNVDNLSESSLLDFYDRS